MAKKAAGIPSPSLPLKTNVVERAEREAQLLLTRGIYEYGDATGLPMPMDLSQGAMAQLPDLVGWIEGQGINQAKIFADLGIWKLETSGSPGFFSFADYARALDNLRKRGVDDPQKLPYYPYRDDGRLIWDCLGNYVKDYLAIYYLSDEDVVGDYELQDWAKQLSGDLDSRTGLSKVDHDS